MLAWWTLEPLRACCCCAENSLYWRWGLLSAEGRLFSAYSSSCNARVSLLVQRNLTIVSLIFADDEVCLLVFNVAVKSLEFRVAAVFASNIAGEFPFFFFFFFFFFFSFEGWRCSSTTRNGYFLWVIGIWSLTPRSGREGVKAASPHRLDIKAVKKAVARYEEIAGAKINFDTSEGLRLGAWRGGVP